MCNEFRKFINNAMGNSQGRKTISDPPPRVAAYVIQKSSLASDKKGTLPATSTGHVRAYADGVIIIVHTLRLRHSPRTTDSGRPASGVGNSATAVRAVRSTDGVAYRRFRYVDAFGNTWTSTLGLTIILLLLCIIVSKYYYIFFTVRITTVLWFTVTPANPAHSISPFFNHIHRYFQSHCWVFLIITSKWSIPAVPVCPRSFVLYRGWSSCDRTNLSRKPIFSIPE